VPVVGFAGDGAFGISMNEMTACGRNEWPPITMVVFRNYQWGAEKRNTILWYNDNFVGTELNVGVEYAKVAEACGLKGVKIRDIKELTSVLRTAIQEQMNNNITTFIEVVLNQELGEPFRRDAMKTPVEIAGIDMADMKPQQVSRCTLRAQVCETPARLRPRGDTVSARHQETSVSATSHRQRGVHRKQVRYTPMPCSKQKTPTRA